MKILPVTSLLVVLALARSSTAQSCSGFTAPWTPTASLAFSAQLALTAGLTVPTPTAPASVTLVALNLQDVRISWADRSSNETGFEIQRETPLSGKVVVVTTVGTTGAGATSFVDTPGLGSFRYRVRAFNASGSSAWTKWASVRIRF
jgi:hypothetical protein